MVLQFYFFLNNVLRKLGRTQENTMGRTPSNPPKLPKSCILTTPLVNTVKLDEKCKTTSFFEVKVTKMLFFLKKKKKINLKNATQKQRRFEKKKKKKKKKRMGV
jgi:hypothetical protein